MSLATGLRSLLQRLRGESTAPDAPVAEVALALDSASAVAVTEASVIEGAGLAAGFPALPGLESFLRDADTNLLGSAVDGLLAADGPSALGVASGMAMSGLRAAAFVDGPGLAAVQQTLAIAAAQHLPLVVHAVSRAYLGYGHTTGSGHEGYHAVADGGCLQLFAANAQEAVDLSLVARRVAERALLPALVAIDGGGIAAAAQEVRLPTAELLSRYLGAPHEAIDSPTPAQRLIFGETRRRVPRWHDLERPLLQGGWRDGESWALAAAGHDAYFAAHLEEQLEEGLDRFARLTGRRYDRLQQHALDGARLVLVAQGSAFETACWVADRLRSRDRLKVGVVGVRCLRPFPAAQLVELLGGRQAVIVLERVGVAPGSEAPLTRELRAAIERALQQGRFSREQAGETRGLAARAQPRLVTALAGVGEQPLRAADLVELVRRVERRQTLPSPLYLGVRFGRRSSAYPRRQTMLDRLRSAYPDVEARGVRADDPFEVALGAEALSIVVRRRRAATIQGDLARTLYGLRAGSLRGRVGGGGAAWGDVVQDWLLYGKAPLRDPGDVFAADITLVLDGALPTTAEGIVEDGALLIAQPSAEASLAIEPSLMAQLRQRRIRIYTVDAHEGDDDETVRERWLGALLGVLDRREAFAVKLSKASSVRSAALAALGDERREACLEALQQGFEGVGELPVEQRGLTPGGRATSELETPLAMRRLAVSREGGRPIDSLPRFWGEVGVLYRSGDRDELVADPTLAAGVVPPLSATFRTTARVAPTLPQLDGAACTGCGACWSLCPDRAIGPVALRPLQLLEAGMALAKQDGRDSEALRPLLSKLAPRVGRALAAADPPPRDARELLEGEPAELVRNVSLPEERKQALVEAFSAVSLALDGLPVIRTEIFFDEPERQQPGQGDILSLAFNPDVCKGCGLCVSACEPGALSGAMATSERVRVAREGWRLWEQLPDTTGETIARARQAPEVGELAALLLSRHCSMAMAGGDGAEAGLLAKTVLRLVLAGCEHELQRQVLRNLDQVREVREQLGERIREMLATALPADDIEALGAGLQTLESSSARLADLSARVDQVVEGKRVDVARMQRLVDAAKGLADLQWTLSQGIHGLGRARLGLVIASGPQTAGLTVFPHNPFQVPVVVDDPKQVAAVARGLIDGQLRAVLEGFIALRRARLELENPTKAALAEAELRALRFDDLDQDERALCPPLWIVAESTSIGDAQLALLLDSQLPVKVLLLADAGARLSLDAVGGRDELGLLALGAQRAFVVQSSLADRSHFAAGLAEALRYPGPALMQVDAPNPRRDGIAPDAVLEQLRLAPSSRAFPLFRLDPRRAGIFGARLDLDGNPALETTWGVDERGDDDRVRALGPVTPAHWAFGQARFRDHFERLDDDTAAVQLAHYLSLAPDDRAGKIPCVSLGTTTSKTRWRPSGAMVAWTERRMLSWRLLQELAGVVTPFTERVQAQAERAVQASHEAKLAALHEAHEERVASLRAEVARGMTRQVRDQLLVLAGYARQEERS